MPGTFSTDLTDISLANSTTDAGTWTKIAGGTLAVEADAKIEGANCLALPLSTNSGTTDCGVSLNLTTTFDSTGKHLFMWRNTCTPSNMNTKANQGVVVHLSSDAVYADPGTNSKKWFVDGSDTNLSGGWKCYVIDPSGTADSSAGTLVTTAIKNVAGIYRQQTGTINTFKNTFYDAIRLGTGSTVTAGTSGAPVTFSDIYGNDSLNAKAWGILNLNSSIYFCSGKMNFGTSGQTTITYFADTNQVLVFNNFPVSTTLYELAVVGAASYSSTFKLGTYSGGLASNGCIIKGAGVASGTSHATWTFTGSNTNAIVNLYNSSFSEMKSAAFNSASEIRYCTFSNFGNVTTNACLIDNTTFQNVKTTAPISSTYALTVATSGAMANITNSKFINCNRAINITAAGTYAFNNLYFSGNTYDVENSSAGLVTINATNGSNVTTYINTGGGTTVINNSVTVTLTGLQNLSDIVILVAGTSTEKVNIDQNSGTTYQYVYTYAAGTYVDIGLFKAGYVPFYIRSYLLPATSASLPCAQVADRAYY